jgi:hypothetical protein
VTLPIEEIQPVPSHLVPPTRSQSQ